MDWQFFNIAEAFEPGTRAPEKFENSFHIVISDDEILAPDTGPWRPMTSDEYRWIGIDEVAQHFLGNIGGIPVFVNEVDPEADNPEGYEFETLWSFLGRVDEAIFYLLGRAKQVVEWYRNHQFCGQCGKPTGDAESDRSRKCHDCGILFYPRLSPSIIVLISRGEEMLLAKHANARSNFYSTLAGFVEPGETIEEAVHREVYEEVGLKVKNLRYFNSQSWPFPNSLMLGFHAEYDSGDIVLQAEEIAEAKWFHYTELPHRPAMVSISGWLIDAQIKSLQQSSDN